MKTTSARRCAYGQYIVIAQLPKLRLIKIPETWAQGMCRVGNKRVKAQIIRNGLIAGGVGRCSTRSTSNILFGSEPIAGAPLPKRGLQGDAEGALPLQKALERRF